MGLTKQEDIWMCAECSEHKGRHDLWFDGICEDCNTDKHTDKMNTTLETQLQKAMNVVNWDNWTDEETNEPAKLGDVYYCKLDWIKDHLEDEEMIDIINDLQETIVPILNELDKY